MAKVDQLEQEIDRLKAQVEVLLRVVAGPLKSVGSNEHASTDLAEAALRSMTQKQVAVLLMIGRGATTNEMAKRLDVSESTIKVHVGALMHKVSAKNRLEVLAKSRLLLELTPEVFEKVTGLRRDWDEHFNEKSAETKRLRVKTR